VNAPIISADSHITEPPGTYVDRIDAAFADRAPRLVDGGPDRGDVFVIDGMPKPIGLGAVAAAGKRPEEIREAGRFSDLHRSGWDSDFRLADQDRDGVSAEVIYPTIGMLLCNHADLDYKKACFDAYNRWLAEYCAVDPARLVGLGQTAMRTTGEAIGELEEMKALGLRGVTLPGMPGVEDYDSPVWDEFWAATVELGLPPSFHILAVKSGKPRGPKMASFLSIMRGCQDILAMLTLGGTFERVPALRVVCAEADAGWVPHFMYRMDHAYDRHRYWLPPGQELTRRPSEMFAEHVYLTFQDDWTAFGYAGDMNWRRLMWANDFPHSDSTWPDSQQLLATHTADLADEQRRAILGGNVAELYGIDVTAATAAV
jgi:predicted TIM-barrel fold metal-dependent hydrolase